MPNKKRRERMKSLYRVKLGRYRLTRRDILVIEKIMRIYADAYETRQASAYGKKVLPRDGRKHMPRKFADMHVIFNGVRADSIKFLPKKIKRSNRFAIRCDPGVWVEFTPFGTVIGAQVLYATGIELKTMKEVVSKLEVYVNSLPKALINRCSLTKRTRDSQ